MPELIFPGPDGRLEGRYHPQPKPDAPLAINGVEIAGALVEQSPHHRCKALAIGRIAPAAGMDPEDVVGASED